MPVARPGSAAAEGSEQPAGIEGPLHDGGEGPNRALGDAGLGRERSAGREEPDDHCGDQSQAAAAAEEERREIVARDVLEYLTTVPDRLPAGEDGFRPAERPAREPALGDERPDVTRHRSLRADRGSDPKAPALEGGEEPLDGNAGPSPTDQALLGHVEGVEAREADEDASIRCPALTGRPAADGDRRPGGGADPAHGSSLRGRARGHHSLAGVDGIAGQEVAQPLVEIAVHGGRV